MAGNNQKRRTDSAVYAVILALLLQFGAAIWWASNLSAQSEANGSWIHANKNLPIKIVELRGGMETLSMRLNSLNKRLEQTNKIFGKFLSPSEQLSIVKDKD